MKLYLDTSVFGGVFDDEFKEDTRKLFKYIEERNLEILCSEILINELKGAPQKVRDILNRIRNTSYVDLSEHATALAEMYVKEGALGKSSLNDAYHIAIATIEEAHTITTWNFKHMIDFVKKEHYNAINSREGYKRINICSPYELVKIISKKDQ